MTRVKVKVDNYREIFLELPPFTVSARVTAIGTDD
jgi:hypothetical protein